jgi:SPP1 family predicted phage head-tail adaptor
MPRALRGTAADAGRREYHILIQQLSEGQAESNFPTEEWTKLTTVWAARSYVTLDEVAKADQLSASTVTEWDIPYSPSMDPDRIDVAKKRRIVYLGKTYDVLSGRVNDRGVGRSIILSTLAKVG